MSYLRTLFLHALLPLSLLIGLPVNTSAGLPTAVEGQPLPTLAPMLDRVTPAVVNIAAIGEIKVRRRTNSLFDDPFFRHFFNLPQAQTETKKTRSLGSGVIIDARKGYVLTNHHVIADADKILIKLRDGRQLSAELLGSDPGTDIALLQIPSENLTAITLADSDKLRVGDFVVAIGNPFGLGQTVTSGIVSALGRSGLGLKKNGVENYEEFIQTDASINVGNSGGALVNLRGELIGINTAILSPGKGGGNVGIGFAIPTNMAHAVMQQLLAHGEIRRGVFGVEAQTLTPELAEAFGISNTEGALVSEVEADSPADKAGLRVKDIVLSVNDRHIRNSAEMRNQIGLLNIGDTVKLEILRDRKRLTLKTQIAEYESREIDGGELDPRLAGAMLIDIPRNHPAYGHIKGIIISRVMPNTAAESAGLQAGDLIESINKQAIGNLRDATGAASRRSAQLLLEVVRGRKSFFVLIR